MSGKGGKRKAVSGKPQAAESKPPEKKPKGKLKQKPPPPEFHIEVDAIDTGFEMLEGVDLSSEEGKMQYLDWALRDNLVDQIPSFAALLHPQERKGESKESPHKPHIRQNPFPLAPLW